MIFPMVTDSLVQKSSESNEKLVGLRKNSVGKNYRVPSAKVHAFAWGFAKQNTGPVAFASRGLA
jgi:hypothetical protein